MSATTAFDPRTLRMFTTPEGVSFSAEVTAITADGEQIVCRFNKKGVLGIPSENLYHGVSTRAEALESGNLVSRFVITLSHMIGEPVVVAQRKGRELTYMPRPGMEETASEEMKVMKYTMPQCVVRAFDRPDHELRPGLERFGVRTDMMNRINSGRDDLWVVKGGKLQLHCLYLVTLDEGESFQLVHLMRGEWKLHRRNKGVGYTLRTKDNRIRKLYEDNADVQKVLKTFAFESDRGGFDDIEGRATAFADEQLRELLYAQVDLPVWSGRIPAPPKLPKLNYGLGRVKFLTYGLGNGSFGLVQLDEPITIDGVKHTTLQFADDCVHNGERFLDYQEVYPRKFEGTVVEVADVRLWGVDPKGKPYPPMACTVRVV